VSSAVLSDCVAVGAQSGQVCSVNWHLTCGFKLSYWLAITVTWHLGSVLSLVGSVGCNVRAHLGLPVL